MYNFSMMPLNVAHFDEICADIKDQYNRGITTCPLFIMTLVPEGEPVWDKVGDKCKSYARFRDELASDGVPSGVLIQASLGHGYDINLAPFTRFFGVKDGVERNVYCPYDKEFLSHFKGVMKRIAGEHPKVIMLDDDFRIMMRPGNGCACKLHMAEFERRTGKKWNRDQMWAHIESHPANDPLTVEFIKMQTDSLVEAIKVFREGIDEVDPAIQGVNCTSGDICDSVVYTAPHFAGKGNPTMVRVPCGTYAPISVREFSDIMRRAAVCTAKLKKGGIEVILGETDTIPFNRYGKNARYLHSHYTAAILEGVRGAKHWITRISAWEPKSGKAFRDILAEHKDFYEALADYVDGIKWVGANSAFLIQELHDYTLENMWKYHENFWGSKCFERLGLPFYFAEVASGAKATFLEDCIVTHMTDEEIKAAFRGSVFVTGQVASDLIDRGFGELIGVSVKDWEGIPAKGEFFEFDPSATCTAQKNRKMIEVKDSRVEVLSWSYRLIDGEKKKLSPAVTLLDRGEGGITVVYAGTPNAEHNYMEGFSFLNESRKRQFVDVLSRAGALPIYYEGDEEVLVRTGRIKDGRLLAAFINLGYDPLEELDIVTDFAPTEISYLDPDGREIKLVFVLDEGGKVKVKTELMPMYPLVLILS
ncbi:MAG: hypothetical protein IJY69_03305 [Clostridia bacterium]|nr:hypothetical protein [Clostridia bacterium]